MREQSVGDTSPAPLMDRLRMLERMYIDTSYAASLAERAWNFLAKGGNTSAVELERARSRWEMLRARKHRLDQQIQRLGTTLAPR